MRGFTINSQFHGAVSLINQTAWMQQRLHCVPVWHHLDEAVLLRAQREHLVARERQAIVVVGVLGLEELESGREEAVEGRAGGGDVEHLAAEERLLPLESALGTHHDHLLESGKCLSVKESTPIHHKPFVK